MAGTGKRRGVQATARVRRQSLGRRREAFLSHFAANCNVVAAAAAAAVPITTLYDWRREDADFAAAWNDALAMGYAMLEARLVAHALAGVRGETLESAGSGEVAPVSVDLALKLMGMHRHHAARRASPSTMKWAPREDVLKVLLDRLELIDKRRRAAAMQVREPALPALAPASASASASASSGAGASSGASSGAGAGVIEPLANGASV